MYLREVTLMVVYALSMAVGANVPGPAASSGQESGHAESPSSLGLVGLDDGYGDGESSSVSCEEARMKCAYRSGCGLALQNYIIGCSGVLYDPNPNPTHCPVSCQHALIALTSSDEGKDLMQCNCMDESCRESKKRVEVCRPSVLKATRNESIVSCEVAQWICSSDGQCSTALEYYQKYCKAMFRGKKCSKRCLNSINILMRQEKAKKLNTCICNKHDDADCWTIQRNMDKLCFNKTREYGHPETNEIEPSECNGASTHVWAAIPLSLVLLLKSISGITAF